MSNLSRSEIIENLAEFRKSASVLADNLFEIGEHFCNLLDKAPLEDFSQESISIVNNILDLFYKANDNINTYSEIASSHYVPAIQNISKL